MEKCDRFGATTRMVRRDVRRGKSGIFRKERDLFSFVLHDDGLIETSESTARWGVEGRLNSNGSNAKNSVSAPHLLTPKNELP